MPRAVLALPAPSHEAAVHLALGRARAAAPRRLDVTGVPGVDACGIEPARRVGTSRPARPVREAPQVSVAAGRPVPAGAHRRTIGPAARLAPVDPSDVERTGVVRSAARAAGSDDGEERGEADAHWKRSRSRRRPARSLRLPVSVVPQQHTKPRCSCHVPPWHSSLHPSAPRLQSISPSVEHGQSTRADATSHRSPASAPPASTRIAASIARKHGLSMNRRRWPSQHVVPPVPPQWV